MKTEDILIALRSAEERYKDNFVGTGNLNISEMASDCAEVIEKLQTENTKLWAKLEQLKTEGRISPVKCPCDASEEAQELMNAKAEGRLIVLPKEGQLYYVEEAGGDIWIGNRPILDIIFTAGWGLVGIPFHYCDIGKTVFLTREEAEAALNKAGDSK